MAFSSRQVPSPTPSEFDGDNKYTPVSSTTPSNPNMLKIQALLNPSGSNNTKIRGTTKSASPPPTPKSTLSSSRYTNSRHGTPLVAAPVAHPRSGKEPNVSKRGDFRGRVNYPPSERGEDTISLSNAEKHELTRQHDVFQVLPYSEDANDLIANYTRHIPYSSDKKSFSSKTGKDGVDVFEYSFRVPGDQHKYTVMWDYDNGLVRITPFFKACNYTKTTPAKALNTNAGLKDLSYSITGGALAAQGYWMPYACARDLCSTFCWDIRWALTPIFGPSFLRDCLKRSHPGFAKFKIDAETLRNAQLEAEGWKTSSGNPIEGKQAIPRSAPEDATGVGKMLPPRAARPLFKEYSPFASDSDNSYTIASSAIDSPAISPKSTYGSSAWTSINRRHVPATPNNSSITSLPNSLLTQPRYVSWRPATSDPAAGYDTEATTSSMHSGAGGKRRRSSTMKAKQDADYEHTRSGYDAEASDSEEDDVDIVVPPPNTIKRARHHHSASVSKKTSAPLAVRDANVRAESRKYRADDYRAAQWLLNLSMRDADLATGPNGPVRSKAK